MILKGGKLSNAGQNRRQAVFAGGLSGVSAFSFSCNYVAGAKSFALAVLLVSPVVNSVLGVFVFPVSAAPRDYTALTVPTIRLLGWPGKSANVLHGSYNVMEGTSGRRRTAPSLRVSAEGTK